MEEGKIIAIDGKRIRGSYGNGKSARRYWITDWCLDVTFREDESRVRIGDAAENFSLLRKIALICLKKETSLKGGIQTKRLRSGWDTHYLLKILRA